MLVRGVAYPLASAQNPLSLPASHLVCHRIVLQIEEVDAVMHFTVLLVGVCNCHRQFLVGLPFHTLHQVFL